MIGFVHRNLDPADRLGEVVFGLIMALGIIGAVRLGVEDLSNRSMFIAIFGCNLAWALVDGVMYVMVCLFERGRRIRIVRDVRAATTPEQARELIRRELGDQLEPLAAPEAVAAFYDSVRTTLQSTEPPRGSIRGEDVKGGIAAALAILLATAPILVPYLVVKTPIHAVRISEAIAVVLLFLVGVKWGKFVGANPLKVGFTLTAVGGILVGVTILLGG